MTALGQPLGLGNCWIQGLTSSSDQIMNLQQHQLHRWRTYPPSCRFPNMVGNIYLFFLGGGGGGWVFRLVINLLCCMFFLFRILVFVCFFCVLTYVLDGEQQTFFGTLYPATRGFIFSNLTCAYFSKGWCPPPPLIVFHHQEWAKFLKADQRFRRRVHWMNCFAHPFWR